MHLTPAQRSRLNYLGIVILLTGMTVGCLLYWRSLQGDEAAADEEATEEIESSRAYQQAVERNVGVVGLLMSQGSEAVAKLGEPRPFAITIMVAANLAAGGCFLLAARRAVAPAAEKLGGRANTGQP